VADVACPDDDVAPPTTICRPGSGDICDPDESCTGEADVACPDDVVTPATTICNPGSGDICDPDESCTGLAGEACPDDEVAPPTTICNPGSGDLCDPDESCTGEADVACPDDVVAPATTICNPGSGDICDPDESCTGLADVACPDDVVAPATTICNPGSGDLCDPDESCTGEADVACPDDVIAPATTICNPGSGDLCDPDESCTGEADVACPDDVIAPATTICNPGSGDLCDPDESCTGEADVACPDDVVAPATTICNPGSGDLCDPDESCTGNPDEACPDDIIAPLTTICRPGSGDMCDPDESCTGNADEACPPDVVQPPTYVCRPEEGVCDVEETCTGEPGEVCPADLKEACGAVTSSSLCTFDMEPDKGVCVGGAYDGVACSLGDNCGTDPNCVDATVCNLDGVCEQENQFRLSFTPDVQMWPAHKANATQPGQFFYNLVYAGAPTTIDVWIPYPFITVGGNPGHIYDATALSITEDDFGEICFIPPDDAFGSFPIDITMEDWLNGGITADGTTDCQQVPGPGGSGWCHVKVPITAVPPSGQVYVNMHLDYGLKGNHLDVNPEDGLNDRYDYLLPFSAWGSLNALENRDGSDNGTGPLAIADCQDYVFSHDDGTELFTDGAQNLNLFKRVSGVVGTTTAVSTGEVVAFAPMTLVRDSNGEVVSTAETDADGFYLLEYKHRGKRAWFTVIIEYTDEYGTVQHFEQPLELKANALLEASLDPDTGEWDVIYGAGYGNMK
jgi:hypothetical protein